MIYSYWFWRKGEDGPEMLTAWDEWSVDGNTQGWLDDCAKQWEAVKDDDSGFGPRVIQFKFDFTKVEEAFYPDEIEAGVSYQERDPASSPKEDA